MKRNNDFIDGWNQALDAVELNLRRQFSHLWPHDQNAAEICRILKISKEEEPGQSALLAEREASDG